MHPFIQSQTQRTGRKLTTVCATGLLLTMTSMTHATSSRLNEWQALYPDSQSDDNASCALCHVDINTSQFNPYGAAIRANGITGAETLDSDNDPGGSSNIEEINADAQPGWSGSAPSIVTGDLDPTVVAENQPPTADPGGVYSGMVGIDVTFDGSGSSDPDGNIQFYDWDFGDGETATGPMPAHIYTAEGSYTVTLTVTDNDGASDTASTTASIGGVGNVLPIADANGPYSGTLDLPVSFDGTGSSDPDGTIVSYDWDYGDGTMDIDVGPVPMHTYTATGDYKVTLTVTDDAGDVTSATTTATIGAGSLPPVADANGPYSAEIGAELTFDGTGSSDPDGTVVRYDWNFGDGTTLVDGGPTPTHAYAAAGTYNVTLTVVDNDGLNDSASTSASVTDPNAAPPAVEDEEEEHDERNRGDRKRKSYEHTNKRDERFWRYRRDHD
jgi:PKD repeat protein